VTSRPASTNRRRLAACALVATLALSGCRREAPNRTPEGAVRELIERLRAHHGGQEDARAAFELLSQAARENLAERASRYGAASGKQIEPEAMLVPSRFLLRFEPHEMTAQIVGAHALVDVVGLEPADRARVPCVFEEGLWRVHVVLPELPPVQLRPDTDAQRIAQ
jgi:hypothetical protein